MKYPIEEYFKDKKQLKRYKKRILEKEELVYLNSSKTNNLELNVDDFTNDIIIIYSTNFNTLKIYSKNLNTNKRIVIKNCRINNCIIDLNDHSFVNIEKTRLIDADIKTQCLYLDKIKGIEDENKKITYSNIKCDVSECVLIKNTFNKDSVKLQFSINTDLLKVSNSSFNIKDAKLNNISVYNSDLFINCIEVSTLIDLINTKLTSISKSECSYLKSAILNCNESKIFNSLIDSNVICITSNTNLYIYNSFIDENSQIILDESANLVSNNNEIIDKSSIYLLKNASFSTNNINYVNNEQDFYEFKISELNKEREKLTKVLKLVVDQKNKSIKNIK